MFDAQVRQNKIPVIRRSLPALLSKALRKAAFEVERLAKEGAPVDTGALRASIYVALSGESDYAEASADAEARMQQKKGGAVLPEIKPGEDLTAIVAVAAAHGIYIEHGTERQAARPFLQPALDKVGPAFQDAVRQVFEKAAE